MSLVESSKEEVAPSRGRFSQVELMELYRFTVASDDLRYSLVNGRDILEQYGLFLKHLAGFFRNVKLEFPYSYVLVPAPGRKNFYVYSAYDTSRTDLDFSKIRRTEETVGEIQSTYEYFILLLGSLFFMIKESDSVQWQEININNLKAGENLIYEKHKDLYSRINSILKMQGENLLENISFDKEINDVVNALIIYATFIPGFNYESLSKRVLAEMFKDHKDENGNDIPESEWLPDELKMKRIDRYEMEEQEDE